MLSKCLNSHCYASFHYLGQGRLFRVDFSEAGKRRAMTGKPVVMISKRSKTYPIEHFWLCENCAASMTVELSDSGEVCLVPRKASAQKLGVSAVSQLRRYAANAS